MRDVRIALLGAGQWGQHITRNLYQLGALHAIGDRSAETIALNKERYPDVHVTEDIDSLIASEEITAFCIATPAHTHYAVAKQVIEAGKDVYVEKPLCLTYAESEELVDLAQEKGCILMGGHLLRYHPHFVTLQKMVQDGKLGEILSIQARRQDLGRFRFEENALWNFAPHDFSLLLAVTGGKWPKQVTCTGQRLLSQEVEDNAFVDIEFEGGLRAHVTVSWLHPIKEQQLVVIGRDAMAVFDDTKPWDEKLQLFEGQLDYDGRQPLLTKKPAENVPVEQSEPLRRECQHFIDCCRERTQPETNGEEALQVMALLEAAHTSLQEGGVPKTIPARRALATV